ncbi:MAG: HAD family hydrolase [bacterium]|nr:HAD family hydrolase [bacterium]
MKPEAILFDLDDTLTDRRVSLAGYARIFASEFGERLEELSGADLYDRIVSIDQNGYNPRRAEDLHEQLPWISSPGHEQLFDHWTGTYPECCIARLGMRDTLIALRERGIELAVVTNGPALGQRSKLLHLEVVDYFSSVAVSGDDDISKPDARIFERALKPIQVAPEHAWFVGDHPQNDVVGARDAGLTGIWLQANHDWPQDQPGPQHRITALPELLDLL